MNATVTKSNQRQNLTAKELEAKMLEMSEIEDLRERRYLWTARAFTVVFAVSVCANIVLVIAIFNMLPLERVEPFLLSFQDKNEQIVNIEKILYTADRDTITESYIRQYIIQRNTLLNDIDEMSMRWGPDGPIRWMSSDVVYKAFVSQSGEALEQIRTSGFTRDVEIISVNTASDNIWQAEIETRDMKHGMADAKVSRWTILLKIDYFMNSRVKNSLRLKNPVGFTVREYSIKPSNK